MSFNDLELIADEAGMEVSGMGVSKTGALQLTIASGSITKGGQVHTLASDAVVNVTADSTNPKYYGIYVRADNGALEIYERTHVEDGGEISALPTGYEYVEKLAWFTVPANETNLDNIDINRRVFV